MFANLWRPLITLKENLEKHRRYVNNTHVWVDFGGFSEDPPEHKQIIMCMQLFSV